MSPDARRLTCLLAGLVAVVAAAAGLVSHSAYPGLLAGVAGLFGGLLGWSRSPLGHPPDPLPDPGGGEADPLDSRGGDGSGGGGGQDGAPGGEPGAAATRDLIGGRVEELQTLVDPTSGLFAEAYLLVALEARIAAARRRLRPVSVVMLDVVEGLRMGEPTAGDPLAVSHAVRATLREADTAGRLTDGRYVLVLEDTNESGAVWTVERLRTKLGATRPGCTVWAGIACYPAHGFTLPEILGGADHALVLAREWRQDRIEVAVSE